MENNHRPWEFSPRKTFVTELRRETCLRLYVSEGFLLYLKETQTNSHLSSQWRSDVCHYCTHRRTEDIWKIFDTECGSVSPLVQGQCGSQWWPTGPWTTRVVCAPVWELLVFKDQAEKILQYFLSKLIGEANTLNQLTIEVNQWLSHQLIWVLNWFHDHQDQ